MLKIRVIPVLFLMNGLIVRSEKFTEFKVIGNPVSELVRYSEWLVDELVYIDISRESGLDMRRDDHKVKGQSDDLSLLREISRHAFMPLTFGGRLESLVDVDRTLANGADKVVINSGLWRRPELTTEVATKYGSQAMVAGIDVKRGPNGRMAIAVDQGRTVLECAPADWARELESRGAGEIFLNSIDCDGTANGFDVEAIAAVADAVGIPVIACGGAGMFEDFRAAIDDGHASAVAAGNIFHFTEHSYKRAKQILRRSGYDVRYPYSS